MVGNGRQVIGNVGEWETGDREWWGMDKMRH